MLSYRLDTMPWLTETVSTHGLLRIIAENITCVGVDRARYPYFLNRIRRIGKPVKTRFQLQHVDTH